MYTWAEGQTRYGFGPVTEHCVSLCTKHFITMFRNALYQLHKSLGIPHKIDHRTCIFHDLTLTSIVNSDTPRTRRDPSNASYSRTRSILLVRIVNGYTPNLSYSLNNCWSYQSGKKRDDSNIVHINMHTWQGRMLIGLPLHDIICHFHWQVLKRSLLFVFFFVVCPWQLAE